MTGITILGGGNTAFAAAANLALRGVAVTLAELPAFAAAVEPIRESRTILLDGVAMTGAARLAGVTTDIPAALAANELVLLIVPSYAHRPFAAACAGHLRPGQALVLMPGNLGTLEFERIFAAAGHPVAEAGVVLAETDTAPYVCRKTGPTAACIWGVVSGLGVAALPAGAAARVAGSLGPFFTADGTSGAASALRPHPHVLACGLSAMNPVVHPAGVLMNAGRIEHSRGDFHFYAEGVTPSVCRVVEAVDSERLGLGRALGIDLQPVAEAFHLAGFGPRGDLWAAIHGSRMLTDLRAPGAVASRWLTEDVPYGLATWASLGDALGIPTPAIDAVIALARVAAGMDADDAGRTLADLGLEGMSAAAMLARAAGA